MSGRANVHGLAVVGSWARGAATPDSDLDLVALVVSPQAYRDDASWVSNIDWSGAGFSLAGFTDADYGKVWSRHLELEPYAEVELSFGDVSWASVTPIDRGTAAVVSGGCLVLMDHAGLFKTLLNSL